MSFWCRRMIRGTSVPAAENPFRTARARDLPTEGTLCRTSGTLSGSFCIHVLAVWVLVPPRFLKDLLGERRASSIAAR